MPVPIYMDVQVPQAISDQLRRGLNILTAIENGAAMLTDDELLERTRRIGRTLFTQDVRFKALAEEWQRTNRPFSGLIFGHQRRTTIGKYVVDLELLAKASELAEWSGVIEHLPLV